MKRPPLLTAFALLLVAQRMVVVGLVGRLELFGQDDRALPELSAMAEMSIAAISR